MKLSLLSLLTLGMVCVSAPAIAEDASIPAILKATQQDFSTIRENFLDAYRAGNTSWDDHGSVTGFDVSTVTMRINARRQALVALLSRSCSDLPQRQRGLARLLIQEIDEVNLSLLAIISDDRGYAGQIRTHDGNLSENLGRWQEGIRLGLARARRCMEMGRLVTGPAFMSFPRLTALPAHIRR